jgi:hypothetical protein
MPEWVEHQENGRPVHGWMVTVCRRFKGFDPKKLPPNAPN